LHVPWSPQSPSSTHVSHGVWQKKPWAQLSPQAQGTGLPFAEHDVPESGHKAVLGHEQKLSTRLGEQ
jgi:hypothetical protein